MVVLSTAVAFVGALCVFDLILSLGVIRRLREQNDALARLSGLMSAATVPVGDVVGAFTATTTTGRVISRESLPALTLVGFFSPDCAPCRDRLPEFMEYAGGFVGEVLAVAVGERTETIELAESLSAVAEVIVEPDGGPVAGAFAVGGLPAMCVLDAQGRVVASGTLISALPVPAVA